MKAKLLAAVILSLIYFGCSDNITSVNTPNENNQTNFIQGTSMKWITVPYKGKLSAETDLTETSKINGKQGGELSLSKSFTGYNNTTITITSSLTVPGGAYNGVEWITQAVSSSFTASDFSPSMTFDEPLILNLKYTGLDLRGINPNTINFYYIAEDGTLQIAPNDGIIVNINTGTLEVKNAVIPHFSRYGFAT